jgi:hypothetical protein
MNGEHFPKRGKRSRMKAVRDDKDFTPENQYTAVEFGEGRPGWERRFDNIYGKTAERRAGVKPEVGASSRRAGRSFNVLKDGSAY